MLKEVGELFAFNALQLENKIKNWDLLLTLNFMGNDLTIWVELRANVSSGKRELVHYRGSYYSEIKRLSYRGNRKGSLGNPFYTRVRHLENGEISLCKTSVRSVASTVRKVNSMLFATVCLRARPFPIK